MKRDITQEYLKSIIEYNPETGIFTWKYREDVNKEWNTKFSNTQAGTLGARGYIDICINYQTYKAHRLAFLYIEGYCSENDIDHINNKKDDNRWKNLREVSKSCNIRNIKKLRKNNSTGVTGVYWYEANNSWRVCQQSKHVGYFKDFESAVIAKYKAELENDYYACLNGKSAAYEYLKEKGLI